MIVPTSKDVPHKIQLLRLLRAILLDNFLANELVFKGGTYASLLNLLDRFSVDLDFDLPNREIALKIRPKLYDIFTSLDLEIKDESKDYLQFFLKYKVPENERNTLKLDINDRPSKFNTYQRVSLSEIRMFCLGHTPETMFANKLVAAKARFDKTGHFAGRDIYDIHAFFTQGLGVNRKVVEDLTGLSYDFYIRDLHDFIEEKISNRSLQEDLGPLVKPDHLKNLLPYLRDETLLFLGDLRGELPNTVMPL